MCRTPCLETIHSSLGPLWPDLETAKARSSPGLVLLGESYEADVLSVFAALGTRETVCWQSVRLTHIESRIRFSDDHGFI